MPREAGQRAWMSEVSGEQCEPSVIGTASAQPQWVLAGEPPWIDLEMFSREARNMYFW